MIDLKGVFFSLFLFFSIQQPILWMFGIAWSWIELFFFLFHLLSWVYSKFMRWIKGLKGVRGNIRYRGDCPFACLINPELLYVRTVQVHSTEYLCLCLYLTINYTNPFDLL